MSDEADTPPVAAGVRIPWEAVPAALRAEVEALAGGEVLEAVTQTGGFSPGAAARLKLAGGGRAFVKAVSPAQNPDSPALYRNEARIAAALPATVPAPRLLGALDEDGWVVLVFEDVEGTMPELPWRHDVLARVVETVAAMTATLDPAPLPAPTAEERLVGTFQGWGRLAAQRAESCDAETAAAIAAGAATRLDTDTRTHGAMATASATEPDPLAWLDPWARRHLDRLVELETVAPRAASGTALVHMDLRADNMLVTPDGRVVLVDWPWALIGAPWLDLVLLAASVWPHGGPEAARIVTDHPLIARADQQAVTAVVAAFAGMLVSRGHEPPPPGLPTLRAFQRSMGAATLEWLKTRVDWP